MPDTHSDSKPEDGVNSSAGTAAPPSDSSGSVREQRALPLWDLILLPLIAVLTVAILGGSSRLIADRETAQSKQVVGTCIQQTGSGPRHGVPNSVCVERSSSGQLVEYRFNSCGDRSPFNCEQKPNRVYRIVLIGSSIPMGWDVQESDSLSERLLADLSRSTHRKVEVYNSAMEGSGGSPDTLANRMSHTMALQPDMILWVISSWEAAGAGQAFRRRHRRIANSWPRVWEVQSGEHFDRISLSQSERVYVGLSAKHSGGCSGTGELEQRARWANECFQFRRKNNCRPG
jgi:hypothetical protein